MAEGNHRMCDNKKNNPIRVLHVLTAMNRAGTETMLMNLYREIDRTKIQFDFAVSATTECDYDKEIKNLGGKLFRYPKYKGVNHISYKLWWNKFFIDHPEYKIVHGHIGSTAAIYLKIAKKHNIFTIAHSHSTGGKLSIRSALYKMYSYNTRNIADYFIGCSKEALVNRYGTRIAENTDISAVLNNGVDVQKYIYDEQIRDAVKKELCLNDKLLLVGTVGRFTEAKNVFFIVDIISELNKVCTDFRFIWAGTGELKDQVKGYIEEKNLEDKIIMLGVRDDIPRILQILNVFILPSKYEGLPVIGVEAQAAGVPMLCSNKVSQEVKMTDCCTFLPIDSPKVWAESILRERTFRRITSAPEDVIKAGYDIRSTAAWLTDVYESVL